MAVFNNTYPSAYQNPYMVQAQYQQAPQNNNNGLIWVQGEAAAKSYLVAPNTSIALWDSEASVVYLKSTDASGMPSMKILDYTIRDNMVPQTGNNVNYATKDDIAALNEQIDAIRAELGIKKEVRK